LLALLRNYGELCHAFDAMPLRFDATLQRYAVCLGPQLNVELNVELA
jgi:hypothetical protein